MLVVPPVEINVECHNTARDHACDQSPEEQQKHEISVSEQMITGETWKNDNKTKHNDDSYDLM